MSSFITDIADDVFKSTLEPTDTTQTKTNKRILDLEHQTGELQAADAATDSRIDSLESDVNGKISGLESTTQSLKQKNTAVEERVATLEKEGRDITIKHFNVIADGANWQYEPAEGDLKDQLDRMNAKQAADQKYHWVMKVEQTEVTSNAAFDWKIMPADSTAADTKDGLSNESIANCGVHATAVGGGAIYLFSMKSESYLGEPKDTGYSMCMSDAKSEACKGSNYTTACPGYQEAIKAADGKFVYLPCMFIRRPYGGQMRIEFNQIITPQ